MLPPPTLSFTIPSVHDQLELDCRVYHPACLAPTTIAEITPWRKEAAIVAHPYAPLGGCFDDPVVDLVASTILKQGFVVGTFNFRGAGNSKGRTSWQSKPEQNDYISFLGFMLYYLYDLSPPSTTSNLLHSANVSNDGLETHHLSPIQSQSTISHLDPDAQYITSSASEPPSMIEGSERQEPVSKPVILLAGYSYGALITCCLPPIISSIISPFQIPLAGSAYSDIRLRAASIASQQNDIIVARVDSLLSELHRGRSLRIDDQKVSSPKTRNAGGSMRMGGGEDIRRSSHESYRSRSSFALDSPVLVKKSVDRIRSMGKTRKFSTQDQDGHDSLASSFRVKENDSGSSVDQVVVDNREIIRAIPEVTEVQPAYLLISPLQGLINNLATMWSIRPGRDRNPIPDNEMKFSIDPTLAVFGDDDVFVGVKRLRAWADKLTATAGENGEGMFRYREVSGAGHFWHDHEAVQILRKEVLDFVGSL